MRGGRPWSFALVLAIGIASGCARAPDPRLTPLTGPLWIAGVDNLWSGPPGDGDPRWARVALGPSGLDRPLTHREGIAWVRLEFAHPEGRSFREPALLISQPADAEEVFVNGVRAGGEGLIGARYVTAPSVPRVVAVPPEALRDGMNVLTMRVLFAAKNISILDGPLLLGGRSRITAEAEVRRRPIIGTEAAFLAMFALLLVFHGFLFLEGFTGFENVLFTGFTATYTLMFLLGGNLLYLGGIASPQLEQLQSILSAMTVPWMLGLVTIATGARFGAAFWLFASGSAAFIALAAALSPLSALYLLATPRKVFGALSGLYYLVLSVRAVVRRRENSIPVLLGVGAYVVGSRVERFWGLNTEQYAMGLFALCMLYALTARHARLRNRLVELSSRLLDAHENERGRIARDIHDGVGQSLLALRMRLQMTAARVQEGNPVAAETLRGLSGDASAILEEVRRVSMDLRPSFVASMSLIDAVSWYAAAFAERSGLAVHVHRGDPEPPDPLPRVKDNLYRALQEILGNAAKHARAKRVDVSVYRSGLKLVLQVSDDGTGIAASAGQGPGIGLSSLRERAELLGGTCSVEGRPGRGTTVTLKVPCA